MNLKAGVADLHMHTTASDGTCAVADRVEQAVERDLDAIAITDHDCIASALGGRVAERSGVERITGVEVRGDVLETKLEILGYYVDPANEELQSVLEQARRYRRERNAAMVDRLAEETGLDLEYERLADDVDGMLGRPHMADALIETGAVESIGEAFGTYLGNDGTAFVPMERVPGPELIEAIHSAGGVASLAHPGRIRSNEVSAMVHRLATNGLDAIEVWYPYDEAPSEGYADVSASDAAALADEHGLLQTGGSDCHGLDSGKFRIGTVRVPERNLEELRSLADDRRAL